MDSLTLCALPPLRLPVKSIPGKWEFADRNQLAKHTKSFERTVERNVIAAHSAEYEVYAVFSDCRVLVACVDPLATGDGIQIFTPENCCH